MSGSFFSHWFLGGFVIILFVFFKTYGVFFRQPLPDRHLTIIAPKAEGIVLPNCDVHNPEHSGSVLANERFVSLLVIIDDRRPRVSRPLGDSVPLLRLVFFLAEVPGPGSARTRAQHVLCVVFAHDCALREAT